MRRVRGWLAIPLLVGLLVTAGCGSGSEASRSEAATTDAASASSAEPAMRPVTEQLGASEQAAGSDGSGAAEDAMPSANSAPAPDSGASFGAGGNTAELPSSGRMIIFSANLTMEVEDYGSAYTEIQNLIHLSDGYIAQFSEDTTQYERSGMFTIKVPSGGFSGFLAKLEQVPNVALNRSMKAQDVSEEYVDLESRLLAKEVAEERLLSFMGKATKTDDLVRFSNELAAVQEQIEQLKGKMRFLEQHVAYSTVELRMYQQLKPVKAANEPEEQTPLGERMSAALGGSLGVLKAITEGILVVAAGALPILIVMALLGAPMVWYIRKHLKRIRTTSSAPEQTES